MSTSQTAVMLCGWEGTGKQAWRKVMAAYRGVDNLKTGYSDF